MRLGQLSRKLGISTSEIINFLHSKDIVIGDDSNTKIEDQHAAWVTEKYAPNQPKATYATIEEEAQATIISEPIIEPNQKPIEPDPLPTPDEQPIELIKAPKIELSGLKVIGKIELPEKKKLGEDGLASEDKPLQKEGRRYADRQRNNRQSLERPERNPIALQREREEREAEKRRKEKALRDKEKKTNRYLSRVKSQSPTKKAQYIQEYAEPEASESEEVPTTWWGKFKKWLRT